VQRIVQLDGTHDSSSDDDDDEEEDGDKDDDDDDVDLNDDENEEQGKEEVSQLLVYAVWNSSYMFWVPFSVLR